jgi:hypothetical protein
LTKAEARSLLRSVAAIRGILDRNGSYREILSELAMAEVLTSRSDIAVKVANIKRLLNILFRGHKQRVPDAESDKVKRQLLEDLNGIEAVFSGSGCQKGTD